MVKKKKWFYTNAKTSGFIAFLIMLSLISFIVSLKYKMIKENQAEEMSSIISVVQQNFQQILKTSYVTTLTLAMTIKDDGEAENFEQVAAKLIDKKSGIDGVQLVRNGIISNVYPLKENRAALNYNILKSNYNITREAEKSIQRKEIYFAGPFKLVQGYTAVVGRLPIFKKNKFWGFSAVVIKLETFIKSSGIESIDKRKYYFQLSKYNWLTKKEEFFLPNKDIFSDKDYKTVTIREGDWKLYLISKDKNSLLSEVFTLSILGILLSFVTGLLITYLLKRPAELRKQLKKKSKRLLISERQYKTLFDQAPIGIVKMDTKTDAFIEVNHQFCKIVGYSEEELKKLNLKQITYHENLGRYSDNMEKLIKGEINEFAIEKRYNNKNGEIVWVTLIIAPLWKNGDEPINHIAIIENITEKKLADQNLKKSFDLVNEQNKRLLNFSYIVSHNLRSHTSNIETIAGLLEQTEDEDEKVEMIGLLKNVSKSLNEAMYDLNEVVSIRTNVNLTIESLNLHFFIEKSINLLSDKISEKKITINNNVSSAILVTYNSAYLESIIYNFISNAIRYSDPKKNSLLEISFDEITKTLSFKDNGIGIDLNKNGDNLFGLYKTFNNNPDSKGIGLFISKDQIEAMSGTVSVTSELNVGTTFSIIFK